MGNEFEKHNNKLNPTTVSSLENFNRVFATIEHNNKLNLQNNNSLNFYMLDIGNGQFLYDQLFDILKDNIGPYGLSRREFKKNPLRAGFASIDKFRQVKNSEDKGAGGELGELLLYLFLEVVMGAPKILSKLEIKTTQNQYVYNADGVHFFKYNNEHGEHRQLILCESKIKEDYKKAIDSAIDSLKNANDKKYYDISLVNSEIFKESFSEEEATYIIDMITPHQTEDIKNNVVKETAFGLFLGFDLKITEEEKNKDSIVVRNIIQERCLEILNDITKYLNNKIILNNLTGFSFYVFLLPFNDTINDRKKIMDQLMTRNHYEEGYND